MRIVPAVRGAREGGGVGLSSRLTEMGVAGGRGSFGASFAYSSLRRFGGTPVSAGMGRFVPDIIEPKPG
jgi:hypothetical protein